jgi:hypothetical protein
MNVLPLCGEFVNGCWRQLPIFTVSDEELRAVGEELRGTALIGFNVSGVAADHSVIRLAE